jgi:glycosyltransferase involved in cell wall biosynthesis
VKPLRVVVDARMPATGWGGVQQVVIGLAVGLTSTAQEDLDVLYLCYPDGPDWLRPYVAAASQLELVAAPAAPPAGRALIAQNVPLARAVYRALMPPPPVPRSDGTLEALEPAVVHFPHQSAFLTEVPSIYQPHDLQHLHLPQFFTRRDIANRERQYRAFCSQASLVAMASTWGRDDILRAYKLSPEKVAVVPLAPVVDRYPEPSAEDLAAVRVRYRLPEAFAYYPAQTWPHKNHARLLEAAARLHDREGRVVPLVFSGAATEYREHLVLKAAELGLTQSIRWVGYVEPAEVRALYRLARCVVVPTLFESTSQPIFEAMSAGVPIVCSNVTATPRQVGDAAVVFDPYSVDAIADAIKRVWNDPALRRDLVARGKRRISEFSWERTARHFAAYYRRIAGRDLSADDQQRITTEPII